MLKVFKTDSVDKKIKKNNNGLLDRSYFADYGRN